MLSLLVGQRELDLGVVEVFDGWPAALAGWDLLHLHDLDGVGLGMMPGTHVSVALGDSAHDVQVLVFPVQVVGATPGVIAQPDAEVLHLQKGILKHLPQ